MVYCWYVIIIVFEGFLDNLAGSEFFPYYHFHFSHPSHRPIYHKIRSKRGEV